MHLLLIYKKKSKYLIISVLFGSQMIFPCTPVHRERFVEGASTSILPCLHSADWHCSGHISAGMGEGIVTHHCVNTHKDYSLVKQ